MTLHFQVVTAGTHTDQNVLADSYVEESQYFRRVKRIALVGSDAVNEVTGKLMYGNREVASIRNTAVGGSGITDDDVLSISSKMVLLPTEELAFILNGVTATNAVVFMLDIEEFMPRRRGRRGFRGRGRRGFRRFRRRY